MPHDSTISTYMRYSFAVLRKFSCAISNFQKINFSFVCLFRSRSGEGWLIFSMLDVLFSRWVFIHLSLHESKAKVLGMPSPEMQKIWIYFMLSNNKFLEKCWYGGQPWIRLAMESESMVEKWINFIFCLPPMIYLAWKVLETLSHFRWWDGYTSQNIFIFKFFDLSSGTSTNPYFPLRRAFLLLFAIFILSLHLLL